MKLLDIGILEEFKKKHTDAAAWVDAWSAEVKDKDWKSSHDIRQKYQSASFLGDGIVIFNIKGTKYRLRVRVNYQNKIVLVMNAGTHQEYMKWK